MVSKQVFKNSSSALCLCAFVSVGFIAIILFFPIVNVISLTNNKSQGSKPKKSITLCLSF